MKKKNFIHEKLRTLRKERNLSQEEIAEIFHVSRQTVSHWENGRHEPDEATILKICEFYHITPDNLYGFETKQAEQKQAYSKEKKLAFLLILAAGLAILSQIPYLGLIPPVLIFIYVMKSKQKSATIYVTYIICFMMFLLALRETYISLEFLLDLGNATIEKL